VNCYLRLWLACPLLSACCCWRRYLCRSLGWVSHSSGPAGFVCSEFSCAQATATSFPLSKHTGGGDTAPTFSGLRVVYSSRGRLVFSPLLWSFTSSATLTRFPTPGCLAHAPAPAGASLARHGLFIYSSRRNSPPPFGTQGAPPSLQCVFIVLIAYYSVSLFSLVGVSLSRGYADLAQGCLWKYHVPFSLPCPRLPNLSEHRHLAARGPSLFLCFMWSGNSLCRLEVWRGQSFASFWWFCLPGVSPASLQDFAILGMLSASSL
jgi:hypothetical protein